MTVPDVADFISAVTTTLQKRQRRAQLLRTWLQLPLLLPDRTSVLQCIESKGVGVKVSCKRKVGSERHA